jgi:hypothetical protein
MASPKSPFKIYRNFLSPKLCEQFCDKIGFTDPDFDTATKQPLKMVKFDDDIQLAIYSRLQMLVPELEKYYDFEYAGTEQIMVEWYAEGVTGKPTCDNSNYVGKKWLRTKERDFTGIVFFSDYQDQPAFDSDYEVYGGKLEFPQHGFGFNPERGTLIVYPSVPHFINATAKINAGELYQARVHIAGKTPYLYDPTKFPGDYRSWFAGL